MKTLYILLLFAAIAQAQYGMLHYTRTTLDLGNEQVDCAIFMLDTPDDITLQGVDISTLPLTSTTMDGMPQSTLMQMGAMQLQCGCSGCDFDSAPDMHQQPGPPSNLLPLPAVEDAGATLFQIMARTFDGMATPRTRHVVAVKLLRFKQRGMAEWMGMVPAELMLSSCRLIFTGPGSSTNGVYFNNGTLDGAMTGFAIPWRPGCDRLKMTALFDDMQQSLENLDASGKDALQRATFDFASYQVREAWIGCRQLIDELIEVGPVNKTFPGSKHCMHPYLSPQWQEDPCCSDAKRFTECCVATDQTREVQGFAGVNGLAIVDNCNHPSESNAVLSRLIENELKADECEAKAKESGADFEIWEELTRFTQTCHEEIYGSNGQEPTCKIDEDCYTTCDKQRGTCTIPWDNPAPYLMDCFIDNIHPQVDRHLRRKWGLTGLSTKEEFIMAFKTNMEDPSCVGPTAWQYNEQWQGNMVPNCDGLEDCHCWDNMPPAGLKISAAMNERLMSNGTVCWHNQLVPADQDGCTSEQACNWQRDTVDCADNPNNPGTTHFCGECHGKECWELSQPSQCYTWVAEPQHCADMGGVEGPWGPWHCVFPNMSEEDCLPATMCPPRPQLTEDNKHEALGDRWCDSGCYSLVHTTEEECNTAAMPPMKRNKSPWYSWESLVRDISQLIKREPTHLDSVNRIRNHLNRMDPMQGAQLHTEWDNSRGACRVWNLWGQQCASRNDTEWFPGRNYAPGRFETQMKCEAGRCNIDDRLNAEQCASVASCTMPCSKCRAHNWGNTLCHDPSIMTEMDCHNEGGQWSMYPSICAFDDLRSPAECAVRNGTLFESCEQLSTMQCSNAAAHLSSMSVANYLQCYVNLWDQCETQAECEASGVCDDWELQNWHNHACFGAGSDGTAEECVGVCILPYDMSHGWPQCSMEQGWSRMGCIDFTITSSNDCSGEWRSRAFTEQACQNHGSGCKERRFWQLTPKQGASCTECGGEEQSFYRWTAGQWITGEMQPLQWKMRNIESINQWQPALNWTKFHNAIDEVAASMMARNMKTMLMCKYNQVASSINLIACDCGSNAAADCYDQPAFVRIGETEAFHGLPTTAEFSGATVIMNEDCVSADDDSAVIGASALTDLEALIGIVLVRHAKSLGNVGKTPEQPNIYEVVTNQYNSVVGQLVGNGIAFDGQLVQPATLCIDKGISIAIDDITYPVADFAIYNETEHSWTPLGPSSNATMDSVRVCASVQQSGTYFPIMRMAAYTEPESTLEPEPPLTAISYADTPYTLVQGQVMMAKTPTLTDGAPREAFSVSPDLPAGLHLHPVSGVLSGAPTATSAETEYTISVGAVSTLVTITVRARSSTTAETGVCCDGFMGGDCTQVDLCFGVVCNNGGSCNPQTGQCTCSQGFKGPSCQWYDCGDNGLFDPATEQCVCHRGFDGMRCQHCMDAPEGQTYLCIPTEAEASGYLLTMVPNHRVPALVAGTVAIDTRVSYVAIHPGEHGHDGLERDCQCQVVQPVVARSLSEEDLALFNSTLSECIEESMTTMQQMGAFNDLLDRCVTQESVGRLNNTWFIIGIASIIINGLLLVMVIFFGCSLNAYSTPPGRIVSATPEAVNRRIRRPRR